MTGDRMPARMSAGLLLPPPGDNRRDAAVDLAANDDNFLDTF